MTRVHHAWCRDCSWTATGPERSLNRRMDLHQDRRGHIVVYAGSLNLPRNR
jgi:hypothetical protein